MSLEITEERIARQPAEAQVIIRLLLAKIAELEARLNQTPRNSPTAAQQRASARQTAACEAESRKKTGWPTGAREVRAGFDSHRPMPGRDSL
jgi:hypothetical protein